MYKLAEKFLRKAMLPSIFCPGCGSGTVVNVTLRLLDKMNSKNFILTSGSGCNSYIPMLINIDALHCMHGRPVVVGTGVKMALPDKYVITFTGDGDCMGIGGNHFIHAARRNIDITVIMINNYTYGMTGGQLSPSTPHAIKTKTSPYGNPENPFDAVALAIGAGATFVARETTAAPRSLLKTMEAAVLHKGFSFIDVISQCPTHVGRAMFNSSQPAEIFSFIKSQAVRTPDQPLQQGQFRVGVMHHDPSKPAYNPRYI